MSHLLSDYLDLGLSGIFVTCHDLQEEVSGNQNEETRETIVARKGGSYVKVSVYERQKFGWSSGRDFRVISYGGDPSGTIRHHRRGQ